MPWILTTPVAVGDLDPNGPYAQVKIVRQAHDSIRKVIAIDLEYGNTVNNNWVPGLPVRSKPTSVVIQGDEYSALVADSEPETNEKTYDAVKRGLYSLLATKNVIGPGTLT
jgi:hypothetical protein